MNQYVFTYSVNSTATRDVFFTYPSHSEFVTFVENRVKETRKRKKGYTLLFGTMFANKDLDTVYDNVTPLETWAAGQEVVRI